MQKLFFPFFICFYFLFLGQTRYHNRPIVEFELAAKEQMKITELRISKLFTANATSASATKTPNDADVVTKARGSVPDWLFPFLIFSLCWSMFYLVSSRVFEFLDPNLLEHKELQIDY